MKIVKMRTKMISGPLLERVLRHTKTESSCLIWTGYRNIHGYGVTTVGSRTDNSRRTMLVHRIMYELSKSKIPKGLFVCHSCDNPPCISPDHLWLGTYSDNMKDCVKKGRHYSAQHRKSTIQGERNPNTKLTWEIVDMLRNEYRKDPFQNRAVLGYSMGLARATTYSILHGKTWKEEFR